MCNLAGEDRIIGQAHDLGAFDLHVPVGALDEADHDPAVELFGQSIKPVERRHRPASEGLHDDAEAVPSGKAIVGQDTFDHIEGQIQPVGFLGVDVEADPGLGGHLRQLQKPGREDGQHRFALRLFIAGVERGQLDRDPRVFPHVALVGALGDRLDRLGIGLVIPQRVSVGPRRFAQHVIGIGVALFHHPIAALHRFVDGAAQHELRAHLGHRLAHGTADHRFAQTLDQPVERADDALAFVLQHPARQQQGPGRGIDHDRAGIAHMTGPVMGGDLVADQLVHGETVGYAQHRLGQAHQCDAFLGREAVFGKETLHHPHLALVANLANKGGGMSRDTLAGGIVQSGVSGQFLDQRWFRGEVMGADSVADHLGPFHARQCLSAFEHSLCPAKRIEIAPAPVQSYGLTSNGGFHDRIEKRYRPGRIA